MKRVLIVIIALSLMGCATLSDRSKWETVPIRKPGWPVESWTYKRCCGQEWVWTFFGNDEDGVTPWFEGRQWGYWEWWPRNRWHNWDWHIKGFANWEEGNPWASWDISHLDYRPIIKRKRVFFSIVKPKHRSWLYWRPFIFHNPIGNLCFWWGWKDRGQFAASIKITDWRPE